MAQGADFPDIARLRSVIVWFLWRGAVFLVPVSTLQRKKEEEEEGGLDLLDVEAKCGAMLFILLWQQDQREGSGARAWQQYLGLLKYRMKPPPKPEIPQSLEYMRHCASDMA
jgi:hypothetical protein